MRFKFILAEKVNYPVRMLCRVLQVTSSGFYAWCHRGPSRRRREDLKLSLRVAEIFKRSRGTYGSPRVTAELRAEQIRAGHNRVARLMSEAGLAGTPMRRFRRTTDSNHSQPIAPNTLDRQFCATAANQVWTADITYVRTWEGWLYVAVILDLYSRRIVGWASSTSLETKLVLDALAMALGIRRPAAGLLHHSDRGCQYASHRYRRMLSKRGIRCSMSRRGDCWDNAVTESFIGTLKTELINRRTWISHRQVRAAIMDYLSFYNRHRRHSSLGYRSPIEFEELASQEILMAA